MKNKFEPSTPQLRRRPPRRELGAVDRAFARFRADGDPEAFATVVRAAHATLTGSARALARDAAAADDLVQTTWIAAMRGANSYDPSQPVVPWLLGILANRARRLRRAEQRTPDPARLPREAPSPDPSETLEQRELERAVRCAVHAMPGRYQCVLDRYLHRGMTPFEIASDLDRPRSTVRTQLSRGLAQLRETLPRDGVAV